MREFFYPSSVAVIGVSPQSTNLGRNIVANLIEYGFNGTVYAVGPRGGTIETHRIYTSVGEIPDKVDLAVILTPAQTVPKVLEECGLKGIEWAIIETAGFREFTEEGRKLEDQICEVALRYDIHFVGPNCIGAINMHNGFCVPFPRLKKFIKYGEVSMITQSGGVGMSVLNLMANEGLGLNKFISIGNMLDTTGEDMLEYLIEDEQTGLIFLYLESINDGRRLMEIARRSEKPILVFKSNIGKLGQNIALSHTASLASDDKVVDAAFHQSGIIRVRDATTLGNNLKILGLPPMKGRNLGVISRSGGHAVIAADACELSGFELARFPDSFLREIEKHFRASVIRLTNPLDLGDLFDLEVYAQIVERTLQLEDVDGIVFLHTSLSDQENQTSRQLLGRIMELVKQYGKPVAYYISTASQEVTYLKQNYHFPIFTQVVETVRALEMSYYYYDQYQRVREAQDLPAYAVDKAAVRNLIDQASSEQRNLLLHESLEILGHYGISVVSNKIARSRDEVAAASRVLGFPLVMKIVAPEVSHKSDIDGVALNLQSESAVLTGYEEMITRIHKVDPSANIEGVLLQRMEKKGREMILGGRQDPQFGPVILVGLGGIFVEVFDETQVRVAPISREIALEMVDNLRGTQILKGARGVEPADIDALIDAMMRLSLLLCDFPAIKELDINPLLVFSASQGVSALDARIILG